ncbi:MAG: endonuclease/exonuclease/phosphatase family protein [Propionibacteriaceae bacterium]|nr:endonuclease/exonuclease/phosphatase family protein [Propionibacteriaceae bacterium]
MNTVRIATWNILWRNREQRLDTVAQVLRKVNPDIVLLQETSPDHAASLAEQIGHHVALVATSLRDTADPISVPAILSHQQPEDTELLVLPQRGDRPHYACVARFGAWAHGITAVSTHLRHTNRAGRMGFNPTLRSWTPPSQDSGPSDPRGTDLLGTVWDRMVQLQAIHEMLRDRLDTPLVFGGDLNFVPDGPEYRAILDWGLADSWRAAPRLGYGETILEANPLIGDGPGLYSKVAADLFPGFAGPLDYTLDFQFTTPSVQPGNAWVFGRPVAGEPWPSDHLGLAVDHELPSISSQPSHQ